MPERPAPVRMLKVRWIILALLIWSPPALPATQAASTAAEPSPPSLTVEPYDFETAAGEQVAAELGRLTVRESRDRAESRTIELAFVRLPSRAEDPGPPILYLAGGPGSSGIDAARGPRWVLFDALRDVADVILLDPRGTGLSRPNLICRQTWIHPPDKPLVLERVRETLVDRAGTCAETLEEWGYRLSAYNAREIADDVEELRRALDFPRLDLLATSFGTHLALTALRRHDNSIRRAVLVGVVGPDQALKLPARVQAGLEELDGAGTGDGDDEGFAALARQVLDRLEREPRTIRVHDGPARRDVDLAIGKLDLQLATIRSLGDRAGIERVITAYREMARGDFSRLAQELRMGKKGWLGSAIPYAILCASGVSPQRWEWIQEQEEGTLLGRLVDFPFPDVCPALGVEPLEEELRTPVTTDTPILMISGTLDLRTPPENATEVMTGLSRGHHLWIEGAGHGDDLLLSSGEIPAVLRSFFAGSPITTERIVAFPPVSPAREVVEHLHGVEVADPYRWLEDRELPATTAWIEAQNRYTDALLHSLPGRDRLAREVTSLVAVDALGFPVVRGERTFFLRRRPEDNLHILYLRQGGSDQVLIDPHQLSEDGSLSLSLLAVSHDGDLLAYGLRQGGEDEIEVRLYDVAAGRDRGPLLPKARLFAFAFAADDRGLYYSRYDDAGGRILYHLLGTDSSRDEVLFGEGLDPAKIAYGNLSDDGRHLVINVFHGAAAEQTEVYLQSPPLDGEVRAVVHDLDATFYGGVLGDRLVLHTTWQAPNGRVLVADVADPSRQGWREIVPEREDAVIRAVSGAGGRLFVNYLHDVHSQVQTFDLEGRRLGEVELPTLGTVASVRGDWQADAAYLGFSSFCVPYTIYRLEPATSRLEVWQRVEAPIDSERYRVHQVWYPSKDGTSIPMFLVHREGLELDSSHPTLLTGYGGFNTSQTPFFIPDSALWIQRGGVYAVANVRGGGELGVDWHRAGVREKRQTVFDDFIAAAEWLVERGYTRPDKLALSGHSNGGLLVAAVMTQRPELFRAVLSSHPLLDMLRFHKFMAGRFWIPEFGSPDDPEDFEVLHAYSPYHRLEEGVEYPAVLFITGDLDTRVAPLHARKMTARMQPLATPERPVLLRYERKAGHAVEGSLEQRIENLTDSLSFLLWQLGEDL